MALEYVAIMQSTDATFGEKLRRQLRAHANFGFTPHDLDFMVRHYAGDVTYQVSKFLDKNRDTLSPGESLSFVVLLTGRLSIMHVVLGVLTLNSLINLGMC